MKQKPEFRIETDLLGEVEIPSTAYWGIRTVRANLAVSGSAAHPRFTESLVMLKRCALDLSQTTGSKSRDTREALLSSCSEILEGKLQSNFIADPCHCNAGVAINANVNDVIANRAEEILGGSIGIYARINPDEDVDLCPGSCEMKLRNAARISLLLGFKDLEPVILDLERWFRRKSLECEQIIHSSDTASGVALWRSLGPELNSYGTAIERCHKRLLESAAGLQEINLTDAAAEDAHAGTEKDLIESVSKTTGISLRISEEKGSHSQSMSEFLQFSSALKELAVELSTISKNLYSSCSKFSESLRVPNKRNEKTEANGGEKQLMLRMSDLLSLTACQVTANDYALAQCCAQGAANIPFATHTLLKSLDLLRLSLAHCNLQCAAEFAVPKQAT